MLGDADAAVDAFRKCFAAGAAPHLFLAAALGLRGEVDEARAALAEAIRCNPAYKSLAGVHVDLSRFPGTPQYFALRENTLDVGLRRAGLPDE